MNFRDFSKALIEAQDLEPRLEVMRSLSKKGGLSRQELLHWIKVSVFVDDLVSEYTVIFRGADINKVRIGADRRNFRLSTKKDFPLFKVSLLIESLEGEYVTFNWFKSMLKARPGVDDLAAWKLAVMLNELLGYKIDFEDADFRTDYPLALKGLVRVNNEEDKYIKDLSEDHTYNVFFMFAKQFVPRTSIPEFATLLRKYHAHLSGLYKPGQESRGLHALLTEAGIPI